jgi:RND family efflux transporter MFP subunit
MRSGTAVLAAAAFFLATACRTEAPAERRAEAGPAESVSGRTVTVRDSTIDAVLEATGTAEPFQRATLSTKLMGSVTAVLVREGDAVRMGQVVARVDARDIEAKRAQVEAGIAEAEAVYQDALVQARRFRSLHADSAATGAQLDAAETGLARAEAGRRSAQAGARELEALGAYAQVRSPFAGIVTQRFVDPGAFVAPGTPVVAIEDASRLRVSVTVTPGAIGTLKRGTGVVATIEGRPADAVVEGVVPAAGGGLYLVNAVVDNGERAHPSGGSATLRLPLGARTGLLVPAGALVREGDLTGVQVITAAGRELRWIRTGARSGELIEVLSGLRAGDRVFVPDVPRETGLSERGR